MLTLTENATAVVRSIEESPQLPDGGGLRIATTEGPGNDLDVTAVAAPQDGDLVVDEDGARVFLEADAAAMLDDKILDARVDDSGGVEFLLAQQ